MRRLLFVIAATLLSGVFGLGGAPARAQLVPNPSFEDHSSCPTNFSQLALADQWDPTTNATPDYYHACGSGGFSVPGNSAGSQSAYEGVAYAGVIAWYPFPETWREYISAPLATPLVAGATYEFSMQVSLAEGLSRYAIDRIGAHFSVGDPFLGIIVELPYTPQIENPANVFLSDSTGWTEVSGSFIAAGGEDYVTIGNFRDSFGTNSLLVNSGAQADVAYYYIDGVQVQRVPNHYSVYRVETVLFDQLVELEDQFGELVTQAGPVDLFANPVDKNAEGIPRPKEHQKWYRVADPQPVTRSVDLNNQFGDQTLVTEKAEYLLVPSEKNGEGEPGTCTAPLSSAGQPCVKHSDCDDTPGDGSCGDLRHFLCYDVISSSGFSGPIPVTLDDQFGSQSVNVLEPSYFCNPVQKTIPDCCNADLNNDGFVNSADLLIFNGGCGGNPDICDINCDGDVDLIDLQILQCQFVIGTPDPSCCPVSATPGVYPIVDSQTHLSCYYIDPAEAVLQKTTNDQFDQSQLSFLQTDMLCVPSEKYGFTVVYLTPSMNGWGYAMLAVLMAALAWIEFRRRARA